MGDAVNQNRVAVLLEKLAEKFDTAIQQEGGATSQWGWGQFLDDSKERRQIGPYGTSAGMIVRALAQGVGAAPDARPSAIITSWWREWKSGSGSGRKVFCQNLRLAFFLLALRLSSIDAALSAEAEEELLKRNLGDDMWGDYWESDTDHDMTPSHLVTSTVVLAFTLCQPSPEGQTVSRLRRSVVRLEQRLLGDPQMPALQASFAAAAIMALGPQNARAIRKQIARFAMSRDFSLADLGVYFYEYKCDGKAGTDYFIAPPAIVLATGAFSSSSPILLRQFGEQVAARLAKSLEKSDYGFKPDAEQRVSTKNQAWAALLLKASLSPNANPTSLAGMVWYGLLRERPGNWWTEIVFPVALIAASATEATFIGKLGIGWLFAAATLGQAAVFGIAIRHLLPYWDRLFPTARS
ncbi:MAG: hypothetical protein ACRD1C_07555 [Terriglobales bacterium]